MIWFWNWSGVSAVKFWWDQVWLPIWCPDACIRCRKVRSGFYSLVNNGIPEVEDTRVLSSHQLVICPGCSRWPWKWPSSRYMYPEGWVNLLYKYKARHQRSGHKHRQQYSLGWRLPQGFDCHRRGQSQALGEQSKRWMLREVQYCHHMLDRMKFGSPEQHSSRSQHHRSWVWWLAQCIIMKREELLTRQQNSTARPHSFRCQDHM